MENSQKSQKLQRGGLLKATDKQDLKFERHQIANTPFIIAEGIDDENNSIFTVCIGQVRMSELYATFDEAKKWIEEITWDKILQVIIATVETVEKVKNMQPNLKK